MRVIVDTNSAENDVGAILRGAGLRQAVERDARGDHIFAFHGFEFRSSIGARGASTPKRARLVRVVS